MPAFIQAVGCDSLVYFIYYKGCAHIIYYALGKLSESSCDSNYQTSGFLNCSHHRIVVWPSGSFP